MFGMACGPAVPAFGGVGWGGCRCGGGEGRHGGSEVASWFIGAIGALSQMARKIKVRKDHARYHSA